MTGLRFEHPPGSRGDTGLSDLVGTRSDDRDGTRFSRRGGRPSLVLVKTSVTSTVQVDQRRGG